jgi:hypothetical protein
MEPTRADGMVETEYVYVARENDGWAEPRYHTGVVKAANEDEAAQRAAERVGSSNHTEISYRVMVARLGTLTRYEFDVSVTFERTSPPTFINAG